MRAQRRPALTCWRVTIAEHTCARWVIAASTCTLPAPDADTARLFALRTRWPGQQNRLYRAIYGGAGCTLLTCTSDRPVNKIPPPAPNSPGWAPSGRSSRPRSAGTAQCTSGCGPSSPRGSRPAKATVRGAANGSRRRASRAGDAASRRGAAGRLAGCSAAGTSATSMGAARSTGDLNTRAVIERRNRTSLGGSLAAPGVNRSRGGGERWRR
jgi:hypothetical protein